ncbi:hypothetical protein DSUL_100146 [Desulfovibrionales bacterium]
MSVEFIIKYTATVFLVSHIKPCTSRLFYSFLVCIAISISFLFNKSEYIF